MYERLEAEGMLEDTVVAICADHGFSFSGAPLRDSFVVNLFLENYNIPFVITGAGHEGLRLTDLRTSKDIAATLCGITDGVIPPEFDGRDVTAGEGYPYVSIEYCGGGCPDLMRRELKIAAFDKKWFVGTLATVDQDIDSDTLTEIYDLSADPLQKKNLVSGKYDNNAVEPLIKAIRDRKQQLRSDVRRTS
jgi:arylsulfatase A-like enzyme